MQSSESKSEERPISSAGRSTKERKEILDGFVLLEACNSEFPQKAKKAVLSNAGLKKVVQDDLSFFGKLNFIDLGENELRIDEMTNLAALEELRMQCNNMVNIESWRTPKPFPMLLILDLSYNFLNSDAISQLALIPRLRELDLTCNQLQQVPSNMVDFKYLEILLLGSNRLSKESCLLSLSQMPRLKELDLSDNKFRTVPEHDGFDKLEWLSLVDNKIHSQEDVEPLLSSPELSQVLLYGNPISAMVRKNEGQEVDTGSKGRHSLVDSKYSHSQLQQEMVLFDDAAALDDWEDREVINIVTDAPNNDTKKYRRQKPKMRGMYSHFRIAKVKEVEMKKASEWRAIGREMMSKASVHDADLEESDSDDDSPLPIEDASIDMGRKSPVSEEKEEDEEEDTNNNKEDKAPTMHVNRESVFLTEPSLFDDGFKLDPHEDMDERERETGELTSRGEMSNLYRGDKSPKMDKSLYSLELTSTDALREELARYTPGDSSSDSKPNRRNHNKLKTAVTALRHALNHPLTSHNDVLDHDESEEIIGGLGYLASTKAKDSTTTSTFSHFEKNTLVSKMKQKPKIPYTVGESAIVTKAKSNLKSSFYASSSPRPRNDKILSSIESVLDRMNFNQEMGDYMEGLRNPDKRDKTDETVDGLLGLVNNVLDNFER